MRSATEPVAGRLELDLGGLKVTLVVAGDCHSQGDLIVLVPSEKVVYTDKGSDPQFSLGKNENTDQSKRTWDGRRNAGITGCGGSGIHLMQWIEEVSGDG